MKRMNKARTRMRCRVDALKVLAIMLFVIGVIVATELLIENLTVVQNLKVNYETEPMGVSTQKTPAFSWNMSSRLRGQYQKSYEIRVYEGGTGQGTPVWTSGVVKSSDSLCVKAEGLELEKEKRYSWRVLVQPGRGWRVTSGVATFVTETDLGDARWIIPAQDGEHVSRVRREAKISRMSVKEAYLYISSLGNYRVFVEGKEVTGGAGKQLVLAPGWTDYNTYVNYQTYDVTDAFSGNLFDTSATVGIELSNGWYASDHGDSIGYETAFGPDDGAEELGVIAKLVLRYANGKTQTITTGGSDWYSACLTDVRFSGICNADSGLLSFGENAVPDEQETVESTQEDGEESSGDDTVTEDGKADAASARLTVDANITREIDRWLEDGYAMPVSMWSGVNIGEYRGRLVSSSGSTAHIADELERSPVKAYTYNEAGNEDAEAAGNTYGSVSEHVIDLKKKKEIALSAGDKLILDYGSCVSGQVDLAVSGISGTVLSVIYAERLNDGFTDPGTDSGGGAAGTVASDGAVRYAYILSGDEEESFFPTETYEIYRYVEISADQDVTIHSASGRVFTSVGKQTARISTSSPELNRLFERMITNQAAGSVSVLNRDVFHGERDGDLSFAQILSASDFYSMDSFSFYRNINEIMQEYSAATEGSYGVTAPVTTDESTGNSPGASDAGILIPWQFYLQTGDRDILEDHFNEMVMYMNRIFTESYSDSLPGDPGAKNGTSGIYMAVIYRMYCTMIMQRISDITGRPDYAAVYVERYAQFREEFMNKYLDEEGNILSAAADGVAAYEDGTPVVDNSQTALLWALRLGLYRTEFQRENMLANLVSNIKNPGSSLRPGSPEYSLDVGLFGIHIALPVLSDFGNSDLAYRVLMQGEYPSWLSALNSSSGESYIDGNAADSAAEWLYRYMAGITQDDSEPGFRKIILQPETDASGKVRKISASYDSPTGTIQSGWEASQGKIRTYTCVIPANTTASLYLPISINQASSIKGTGIRYVGMENHNGKNCALYELAPGSYRFRVPDAS